MRTSSFSNPAVINLLSQYFVPVWLSVDDYGTKKSDADAAEWQRVQKIAKSGNIFVHLIAADGSSLGKMNVTQALDAEKNLLPLLRKVVAEQKLQPRKAEAVRATAAPFALPLKPQTAGSLLFHLWTIAERGRAEDWFELTAADGAALAPPADAKVNQSWKMSRESADKLFLHFYPPTSNYRAENGKVLEASMTGTVTAVSVGEIQVVFRGAFKLQHNATCLLNMPAEVSGTVLGAATYDRKRQLFTSMQLATEKADHLWHWQGNPATTPARFAVELVAPER